MLIWGLSLLLAVVRGAVRFLVGELFDIDDAGTDNIIKISTVSPISEEILQPKISLGTHYIPRLIALVEGTLCSASDDWTTHMYSVDLERKGFCFTCFHIFLPRPNCV